MRATPRLFKLTSLAALCAFALPALATNGYFPHGYGIKAKGMGGAAVAIAQDSLGGANNPASMVFTGSRMDIGMDWFSPKRDATRINAGPISGSVDSGSTSFFVPEFGYNAMLSSNLSLGVSVYGNGGMNTNYPEGNFNCGGGNANMLCGSGALGVDLMQLVVAPTLAYKLAPQHAVGVALLLGFQQFKAYGVQVFDNPVASSATGSVTNNNYDQAQGIGLRIGYMGRLSEMVTVGAAYAPKLNMSRFDSYKGLFAGQGDFDIPAHYALGVAITPTPAVTVALDFQRIEYSGVASVANPSSAQAQLGSDNGPGFGWQDINVFKLGVQWKLNDAWTLRAGWNHGDNPISGADVTFNILAPGVMTNHYTAGFSWAMGSNSEISASLMVAPRVSVSGNSSFGGSETIRMSQRSFGLAWHRKF